MTNVASKNPYDLLGNDPELDPDREPEPPTKIIDKPVQRTGKRNAGAEGPPSGTQRPAGGGRGGRHEVLTRGDQAGSLNNRAEKRDDGIRQDRHANRTREPREHRGGTDRGGRGRGEGRGGRGFSGRFQRTNRDDRGDHSGLGEHDKQAAHGWGDEKSGTAEWNDEKAGEEIARAESKDEPGFTPDTSAGDPAFTNGPGAEGEIVDENALPAEPEDKTKSYDEYLAEQAEKRLALGNESLQVRKANEGSKQKFPEGTAVSRQEESFIVGSGGKAKREKANQQAKQTLQLDGQYYAPTDSGDRGGRGRGRGGRGRGEFRGDRGDRGDRGGRGEFRGDRGDRGDRPDRGDRGGRGRGRGEFRGGSRGDRGDRADRGGSRGGFNATDSSAFPALGGS